MSAISDALKIPHFTCARGSTVERPFLEAVAAALGVDGSKRNFANKDELLFGLIRTVSDEDPQDFWSRGGTITNEALAEILKGIAGRGFARVSLTDGGAAARIAAAIYDESSDPGVFDPLDLSDERKRALREVVIRQGQGSFRNTVLNAYRGRCAVTGMDVPESLEAAHIRPYRGPKTNTAANGMLLRADLHRLWDTGLMAVDEVSYTVLLAPRLMATAYVELSGRRIEFPDKPSQHPSPASLKQQRIWAEL
jgi:hypothetical protein